MHIAQDHTIMEDTEDLINGYLFKRVLINTRDTLRTTPGTSSYFLNLHAVLLNKYI